MPASTPAASSSAIAATICPRVSAKMSEPPATDRLQRALHALLGRRVGDEAVHPLRQRHVRRVRRPAARPRPRRGGRPRRGRRPRPARRGWGSGGRACRCRRPRAWPRRPARRRCPRSANSSVGGGQQLLAVAAGVGAWLRWSSECKRRVPPFGATLMQPEESSVSILGGTHKMSKVWFITGTSKGFGRVWAEAALERGDRVAATARNADTLTPLVETYGDNVLPLALDVTDKAAIDAAVKQAHERFGRLDVVVNNAGYGLFGDDRGGHRGAGPRPDRDEPVRRAVGHAGGAPDHARAGRGPHHPGVVDRRRQRVPDARALPRLEVGPGGLQPVAGGRGRRLRHQGHDRRARPASRPTGAARPRSHAEQMPDVRRRARYRARLSPARSPSRGDPQATGSAILELVDADEPPLRVFFGTGTLDMIRAEYEQAARELGALGPHRRRRAGRRSPTSA